MGARIYWNEGWEFTQTFTEKVFQKDEKLKSVRLPHTVKETPFNNFDESCYQMISGYRKYFYAEEEWIGKHVLLTFEGAAHEATVYVDKREVAKHSCGYTAFTIDLAPYLKYGQENQIVVKLNSCENLNVPPFGNVIDYMTYGGIYRDVYLDIKEEVYLDDVFIRTKDCLKRKTEVIAQVTLNTWKEGLAAGVTIWKEGEDEDTIIKNFILDSVKQDIRVTLEDVALWSITNPQLYYCKITLFDKSHHYDEKIVRFGFREAEFLPDGFYLNGEKIKIRGLNRHQSFPYVGYAMPKSQQIRDVDLLKFELGANAVRTSHYPQSKHFVDRCDEMGLLVFTEMPGWQHIGDEEWKETACRNVEEMVRQYRNHPSIILWGVRINESADDDAFYKRTNQIAHELDESRGTGGVRCIKNSNLLEDVYTYNDFSYEGVKPGKKNRGVEKKKKVTSDMSKGYLVSEYNGHMFPTKSFDCEEHRVEHALRHAQVLNDIAGEPDIAGGFAWCMFDYNTHKDFGSGDRICYHGVMDMFRNPKTAAYVYQSQQDAFPVLEVGSSMDIGEHPGCYMRDVYAFTNADSIRFYKNDVFIKEYTRNDSKYRNLAHGPVQIDDVIGNQLVEKEGFSVKKSEAVKRVLSDSMVYGMNNLPFRTKVIAARLILFHGMKFDDAVTLYNRYVGIWGGQSTSYRFEAIKDGKVVKVVEKGAAKKAILAVDVDHTNLVEDISYDVASIRIKVVDEHQNIRTYYQEPIQLKTEGAIELIGPSCISLKGGMSGTYVRTTGAGGTGKLILSGEQLGSVSIDFTVDIKHDK